MATIARIREFEVQSDSGDVRTIVCSEEHVSAGSYHYSTGKKSYEFDNGEPAATIGDMFMDRSGTIYRRVNKEPA